MSLVKNAKDLHLVRKVKEAREGHQPEAVEDLGQELYDQDEMLTNKISYNREKYQCNRKSWNSMYRKRLYLMMMRMMMTSQSRNN